MAESHSTRFRAVTAQILSPHIQSREATTKTMHALDDQLPVWREFSKARTGKASKTGLCYYKGASRTLMAGKMHGNRLGPSFFPREGLAMAGRGCHPQSVFSPLPPWLHHKYRVPAHRPCACPGQLRQTVARHIQNFW